MRYKNYNKDTTYKKASYRLSELEAYDLMFPAGATVNHEKYGDGIVSERMDSSYIRVNFPLKANTPFSFAIVTSKLVIKDVSYTSEQLNKIKIDITNNQFRISDYIVTCLGIAKAKRILVPKVFSHEDFTKKYGESIIESSTPKKDKPEKTTPKLNPQKKKIVVKAKEQEDSVSTVKVVPSNVKLSWPSGTIKPI